MVLEGNILLLLLIIIGVIVGIVFWFKNVGEAIEDSAKERQFKKRQKKGKFTFERVDDVQGILTVNGNKIRTYNVGDLMIDEKIQIIFYDSPFSKEIRINDIYYQGSSLFLYAAKANWRENAKYSVAVLKSLVNNGQLNIHLANEVDDILQEVEDLNEFLKAGNVIRTEDDGFAWIF